MILITGATGHFGKLTIDFLLKKGVKASEIAALVRDEAKAAGLKEKGIKITKGDYDHYDALVNAFKGVDKLLFVSGNDVAKRIPQHENVVNAAKEAGVQHIVYTSFSRKKEDGSSAISFVAASHIKTEQLIKASGIPYTIFRNGIYSDVLPMFLGEKVLETGVYFPAGGGKASFTARQDMAEAAAVILTEKGHENKEYELVNEEVYSLQDVANELSKISGKAVSYTSPDVKTYTETLAQAGVPAEYTGFFAAFAQAIEQGEFETSETHLTGLLGRKPTTLAQFLSQTYQPSTN
jgi:NAD(P)H dehydrogenase (quinone)